APVALPQPLCLAQRFVQQVERTPDAVAVICEQQQITYRALDRRANQLAHYLQRLGVGPDQFVGVALERSLELVVALLGILKAGGAYLPLDPDYPSERLAYMVEDAGPVLLLTQHSLQARLPATNVPLLSLDQLWETLRAEPEGAPAIALYPEQVAYVIYTSGSTGRPKGTMITQQGICNSLQWMQATYPLAARDCVLQKTSLSFDPSVWELFWPLLVGARLTLARPGGHADHGYLFALLAQEEVTTLNFAPAELRLFVEEPGWEQAVSVRRVMCGGEALSSELLQRFSVQKYAQLTNLYGPTEATIEASFWICEAQNGGEGIVPIECPIANGQSYMLDVKATDKPFLSTYSLSQLFEQQVERTPDVVALICEQQQMTYRVLDRHANQLAHALRRLGVGPDQFVGVALERSLELVVVLLGILKAGGAYLPLDPNHPSERLAYMLEDARPALLLTQRSLQAQLPLTNTPRFYLDQLWETLRAEPESTPAILLQPEHLAYVIYTSGSTGRPKGVMGTHRASLNRFHWMWQRYPFGPAEVCCQKTNLSFVDAVWEIFGPLLQGVPLVIMADEVVKDPVHLRQLLERQAVTRIVLVPSLLRVLLEDEQALQRQLHRLTYWVSSGEPLALEVAQRFRRCLPEARLINLYGSSEVTADVTYYEVTDLDMLFSVPIGRPIANTQLYVLDAHHELVPVGVTGELYIGGVGLARGYHRRPELTAERFMPHPWSQVPGQRLYRTGDLVRYRADGVLEFQGRIDTQVKLRGFRIELGEVEAVLRTHPAVRDAVVVLREETKERSYLVAYVIALAEGEAVTVAQLQAHMRRFVPDHMVPAFMILLEAFPLTPHGKVDRRALPLPDRQHNDLESYCAPQTPVQETLALLWADLFQLPRVGIKDNFFALGGHSLLAIQLLNRIQRQVGRTLSLASLLQAATIEQQAALLQQEAVLSPFSWSSLVVLRQTGGKRPFFCVHPVTGTVYCYLNLVQHLQADRPFYGFQSPGLYANQHPHVTVEEMATAYLYELQAVQPEGPYLLGGYSLGGLVAFEMAVQLQARGYEVALLVLLDTVILQEDEKHRASPVDGDVSDVETQMASLLAIAQYLESLKVYRDIPVTVSYEQLSHVSPEEQVSMAFEHLKEAHQLPQEMDFADFRQLVQMTAANGKSGRQYRPEGPYKGHLVSLNTEQTAQVASSLWPALTAGSVEVVTVPGDHYSMLTEPHIQVLAAQLQRALDEADRIAEENRQRKI
ncbi:MAG TPA: amino acid adenylation domain-containing protein, partial [Ktedonobacteraceae bacterium]|nr:amino acid adenylation domain-containing protein [Ktedonobacteraceae bacterium]